MGGRPLTVASDQERPWFANGDAAGYVLETAEGPLTVCDIQRGIEREVGWSPWLGRYARVAHPGGLSPEAQVSLVDDPHDRIERVRPAVESLGGRTNMGWLSFGEYDVVAVVEMPGNASAAALCCGEGGRGLQDVQDDAAVEHGRERRSDEEGSAGRRPWRGRRHQEEGRQDTLTVRAG
jgi:hypothetical protein